MLTDVVLVHTGKIFPNHINDCISLLRRQSCNVHLIIESKYYHNIDDHTINIVDTRDIIDNTYNSYSIVNHDRNFRDDFFSRTSSRFILINSYAVKSQLESFFHIENDVAVLQNMSPARNVLCDSKFDTAIVIDNTIRCVPSILWFRNNISTKRLSDFIYHNNFLDDMQNLARYYHMFKDKVTNLPIVPFNYFDKQSPSINYGNMYDDMMTIFDGAAIGQYLYGTDPKNNLTKDTNSGFINETCSINYSNFNFSKTKKQHFLVHNSQTIPILNLHMHCKNLKQLL